MAMRLTDVLKPQNIRVPLTAANKADAIRELVDLLAANGEVTDAAKVLESVLEREATRTTGIGYGLAIPHGKTGAVPTLTMAVGRCERPINFDSIDGKPVSIIWMLVSPPDKTGLHIATLAKVSRVMLVDKFRAEMNRAADADAMFNAVKVQESEM